MSNPKLKIGLDLRGLESGFKAHSDRGTGTYIRELTKLLHSDYPDVFDFINFTSETIGLNKLQKKILKNIPRGKVTFESQICLRKNIKKTGCDIAHFFSHGDAPSFPLVPQIVTILDLIPLKFPHLYQSGTLNYRFKLARFLENKAAISSSGIIAISNSTKKDIINILEIPSEKIFVTHLGVSNDFLNPSTNYKNLGSLLKKLSLEDQTNDCYYGLYVGGLDSRKNIPFLLDLSQELRKNLNNSSLEKKKFKILIAGNYKNEKNYPKIKKQIAQLGLDNEVVFLGFVDRKDLISLYKLCNIFLFPSLYEGFGLPVLEAMCSGIPILAGNNSCMGELMGNSSFLVEDNNLELWIRSLITILKALDKKDPSLLDLIHHNQLRASQFTWKQTAESTINAYKEIIKTL